MRKKLSTAGHANRPDDPRGISTRALLIECAETMVAEYGINGVSIRQIAKAGRSSNSSVVAYHFGDKEALLRAVIDHRLPSIEQRRKKLLALTLSRDGTPSIGMLVDVLYRPFFEQRNSHGQRSYAAFVDELSRANLIDIRTSLNANYPITSEILDKIRRQTCGEEARWFSHRMFLSAALIFAAIKQIDQTNLGAADSEQQFDDAIAAAAQVINSKTEYRR